ncbi:MAG: hypothetical protein BHV96_05550 [Clostridium sp. CAG:354_28_25]|jgi:hypothetical protein|nr:MAG: hypothetical protein BHV96_05550 [Clostridium sp. CAG:354_28_25]
MDKLLKLAKQSLSIVETATAKDEEIKMWINAGIADLKRQDIDTEKDDSLIDSAIVMFVKSNFGNVDIKEKELAQRTYNLLCANLGLSTDYKVADKDA